MRAPLIAFTALLTAGTALAQQPGVPAPEAALAAPQSETAVEDVPVNQQIIYGDDPCTGQTPDEIVICVRMPEEERFRIPPNLRHNPNDAASQSWTNRAIELSYVGRTGTDSCSTVGGGGFTGCFNQLVRQARAERAGSETVNWNQLIEQARQERLGRIDEAAAEDDQPTGRVEESAPEQPE